MGSKQPKKHTNFWGWNILNKFCRVFFILAVIYLATTLHFVDSPSKHEQCISEYFATHDLETEIAKFEDKIAFYMYFLDDVCPDGLKGLNPQIPEEYWE